MPKVGANIYKRRDGRWEGRYIKGYGEGGGAKYGYAYAKSYTEVKQKLFQSQFLGLHGGKSSGEITFGELCERWLAAAKLTVKTSTYSGYVNMLNKQILPILGGYKLGKLSSEVFDKFTADKLKSGRLNGGGGLSAKYVRDILSLIKSVVAYGEKEKLIAKDSLTISYPKSETQEIRILSKYEQARLERVLTNDTDTVKLGILLCLYTGLRIGELCALKWKNICLTDGYISVCKTIQRIKSVDNTAVNKTEIIIDTPKSKSSVRIIPLPPPIADKLKSLQPTNSEAFFLTGIKDEYIEPRTLSNRFKSYLKECNIDKINFHALRHTFGSRCIEVGIDAKCLSEILGHSSVNLTLNRYVHSSFKQKQVSMEKLCGESVLNILSPSV